jgi:hypothetical protein
MRELSCSLRWPALGVTGWAPARLAKTEVRLGISMTNVIEPMVLLGLVLMEVRLGTSMANVIELMVLLGLVLMEVRSGISMANAIELMVLL